MNKKKHERAEQRAQGIALGPLSNLEGVHITNCTGRFNDQNNFTFRISKDHDIQTPDIVLKVSAGSLEIGPNFSKSTKGSVTWNAKRVWESVSEEDLPARLNQLCKDLSAFYDQPRRE